MAFAILRRILPTSPKTAPSAPPMPPAAAASPAPSTPTEAHSSAASAAAPSASSATTAECEEAPRDLRAVCAELDRSVTRFLEEEVQDEVLRGVQGRVKESMGVIAEALERYTCVSSLVTSRPSLGSRIRI